MARLVDVSNNNGQIDWHAVRLAGIKGAWIKAAQGLHFEDHLYHSNRVGAVLNGIRTGAYYFGEPDTNPIVSAQFFLELFKLHKGDLLPALDLEVSGSHVRWWASQWLSYVHKQIGAKPIIYSGDWFMRTHGLDTLGYPLWVASYGAKPHVRYAAWQYTDHLLIGGKVLDSSVCPNLSAVTYKPHKATVVKKPVEPLRRWWFERHLIGSRKSQTRL